MFRRCVALLLVGSLMIGCQTGTQERVLMRYDPAKVQAIKAPYNGEYRLYRGSMPATQTDTPLLTRKLASGDLLGFSQEGRARLIAITRTERTPLDEPSAQATSASAGYTWTMRPDPGQIDAGKTALLVLGVGAVVAIGVGIAVGVSAAQSPWGIPTWP